jgi:ribose transport system ATP-binding protein
METGMDAPRNAPISREAMPPGPAAILSATGITHAFFGNRVLTDVAIEVHGGSIHALLGENGAGKSTLIGILSGGLKPDAGTIVVGGETHTRLTPAHAQRFGIAVVHQELSLAPHLSVAENVALGRVPRRAGLIDYAAIAREVSAIFADLDLDVPLATPAETLPLGTRQLVEIAKALYRKPRLLILDEPTSSLTAVEVTRLKRVMMRLRDQGIGLLFISHRLDEVLELCDRATVLKDGRVMTSQSLAGVDGDALVRLMVGRDPGDLFPRFASTAGEPLLEVQGLQSRRLTDIGFTLRRGEVLGLGGLIGQGQEDLLLSLFGAEAHRAARLALDGRPVAVPNVRAAARLGIAYVPSDRKVEGLHLPQSLHFNLVLPTIRMIARHGLRRPAIEKSRVAALLQRFAVRGGSAADRAIQLSGGNQQKIAIAKWLPLNPRVLLLNDPTRGVDVETKRELYLMLRQLAAAGTSIILASSDTPELVELCDRVLVLADGRVRVALERGQLSEEAIVSAALGAGGGAAARAA